MNNWTLELREAFDGSPATLPFTAAEPSLLFVNGEWQILDGDRTVGIVSADCFVAASIRPAEGKFWMTAAESDIIINSTGPHLHFETAEPEHVWLDAEALKQLPTNALILGRREDSPRRRVFDRSWRSLFGTFPDFSSLEIAPARVLWTPDGEK